jgi:AGCS family alanine or glycine:cation symporter
MAAFFAGLGGCVGIGNVVAITTAVQIGGPGSVFWMWVTAIVGSLVKYSEVFLGIRYRVPSKDNSFIGGPMYFLAKGLSPVAATFFCIFMCIYGVEIFQFSVVTNSISHNFGLDKTIVTIVLLVMVIVAAIGGVRRIANICSSVIPLFIVLYIGMGGYVLYASREALPEVFSMIFNAAFSPMAPVGSFVGSSLAIAITQGMRRGCYSSDIGVGYASIIHSATRVKSPAHHASLVIFEVIFDTFIICTMSVLLVLVSGTWKADLLPMHLVQEALGQHFPYMNYFMPFFLFLLGYTTVITYFSAGLKTAEYMAPKYGPPLYYVYSVVILFIFSFVETKQALIVMSIVQVMLLALNLLGILRLRKEIGFNFAQTAPVELEAVRV